MTEKSNKKVIFLSANAGTGHYMAAKALADSISNIDNSVKTEIINAYQFLGYPTRVLMENGYIHLINILPGVYGYFYERKSQKKSILSLKNWLNRSTAIRLKNFIDEQKPDAIVCTHAFPCGVMSQVKREFNLDIGLFGVVTDYVVNPFWIYPETDYYMVAHDDLKEEFYRGGINDNRLITTGIPVDQRLCSNGATKASLKKEVGLTPDAPVLLIMGGGLGMKPVTISLKILENIKTPLQAVIITGNNQSGRKKLERELKDFSNKNISVKILGYIDNVFRYMKAADLLLTKPGGMTASEAIAAKLPMIITTPLPGQESLNTKYLIKKGLAEKIDNEKELPAAIDRIISDPGLIERMSGKAGEFAFQDPARKAAEHIYSFIK